MKSQFTPDYMSHIAQAIQRINNYIKDIDKEAWIESTLVQDAVIRNLEVIRAASHNVPQHHQDFEKANADVPWSDAGCMRNALSCGYFQVDLDIVWEIANSDLPVFLEKSAPYPSINVRKDGS